MVSFSSGPPFNWIIALAPSVQTAVQGFDTNKPLSTKVGSGACAPDFIWTRTIQDDVPIARHFAFKACQFVNGNLRCTGNHERIALEFRAAAKIQDKDLLARHLPSAQVIHRDSRQA